MKISDIKIGERFRKDLGDIKTLANSIKEIGLLQPVVVNENKDLIAGHRRIEAHKLLGLDEIPTTVVNLEDILKGELHENAVRKDFTTSERVAILEDIERRRIGHRQGKGGNLPPFQEENKGKKSRDIAAQYTGVSPRQLQKEKKIVEVVNEIGDLRYKRSFSSDKPGMTLKEMLEKVDSHKMSVDKVYKITSKCQRKISREVELSRARMPKEVLEKFETSMEEFAAAENETQNLFQQVREHAIKEGFSESELKTLIEKVRLERYNDKLTPEFVAGYMSELLET